MAQKEGGLSEVAVSFASVGGTKPLKADIPDGREATHRPEVQLQASPIYFLLSK